MVLAPAVSLQRLVHEEALAQQRVAQQRHVERALRQNVQEHQQTQPTLFDRIRAISVIEEGNQVEERHPHAVDEHEDDSHDEDFQGGDDHALPEASHDHGRVQGAVVQDAHRQAAQQHERDHAHQRDVVVRGVDVLGRQRVHGGCESIVALRILDPLAPVEERSNSHGALLHHILVIDVEVVSVLAAEELVKEGVVFIDHYVDRTSRMVIAAYLFKLGAKIL